MTGSAARGRRPRWVDGLLLACGTLGAVPVPPPGRIDCRVGGWAMALAPVAALPGLAVLAAGWAVARFSSTPTLLVAALAVAGLALLTRAMHLDGLADTADGLSAGDDRARSLEVMRRGDIGPSGVAALALVLLVQVAALSALLGSAPGAVLAGLALLLSRHLLAWACLRGVPAARPEGLGATVAGSVDPVAAASALVVLTVSGAGCLTLATGPAPWWAAVGTQAVGILAGVAVVRRAVRRLGGVTGDVLGAVVEVGFAAALAAAVILLGTTLP
ncbi:MAG TPA: adenosylcobinamide-GDP ribazoletransferase [Segeticoccus sp.]|nr:adenosylcobinamide-GDP ribazoletransferase [Segeticoccus sp.]